MQPEGRAGLLLGGSAHGGSRSRSPEVSGDPRSVETMLPVLAVRRVGSMAFAAIDTRGGVWTWHTQCHRKDGGDPFGIACATVGKQAVVLFPVQSLAQGTMNARKIAKVGIMTPTRANKSRKAHPYGWMPF